MLASELLITTLSCSFTRPFENKRLGIQTSVYEYIPVETHLTRADRFTGCLFDISIGILKSLCGYMDDEFEKWLYDEGKFQNILLQTNCLIELQQQVRNIHHLVL